MSDPVLVHADSLRWQDHARCLEVDPEIFFPERGGSSRLARAVCEKCPVQAACLRYAIRNREQFGIWGNTSERERRRLRKDGGEEKAPDGSEKPGVAA